MEQAKIQKVVEEHYPAMRFVGKKYTDADRDPVSEGFDRAWEECNAGNWFAPLEKLPRPAGMENGVVGLMGMNGPNNFEYWIGVFAPEGTPVPEGYEYADLPALSAGVCWLFGQPPGIFWMHEYCAAELLGEGLKPFPQETSRWCSFERFNNPRYTTQDAAGNRILDYGIFVG
ncbi:MAG: hypothetical protein LBP68_06930 [Acidobacteriota bacterium]|jgi:hypothetical protein|nr:hypothetical protein [Acidobacteriota bacterium]